MIWKMDLRGAFPLSKMRSSDLSSEDFQNLSSGTQLQERLPLDLRVLGSLSLMCLYSGLCWWFIGWFCSRWRVRIRPSGAGQFRTCPVEKANKTQNSAKTDPAYDQIPLRAILNRQDKVHQEQLLSSKYWENRTVRKKQGGNFDWSMYWCPRSSFVQKGACWCYNQGGTA